MTRQRALSTILFAALILSPTACSDDPATTEPTSDGVVGIRLGEYTVEPAASAAPAGLVKFQMHNAGKETHELLVVRTDLPLDGLPVDELGDVREDGEGLTFVDEREGLQPGSNTELAVALTAGRYVLLCNLPEHYKHGMVAEFTVTGTAPAGTLTTVAPAPEALIVSDQVVANGLTATVAAMRAGASADELYKLWFTYEGTIRSKDQNTYLDLEDQLAAIKHAESNTDSAARDSSIERFAGMVDAYLVDHPG